MSERVFSGAQAPKRLARTHGGRARRTWWRLFFSCGGMGIVERICAWHEAVQRKKYGDPLYTSVCGVVGLYPRCYKEVPHHRNKAWKLCDGVVLEAETLVWEFHLLNSALEQYPIGVRLRVIKSELQSLLPRIRSLEPVAFVGSGILVDEARTFFHVEIRELPFSPHRFFDRIYRQWLQARFNSKGIEWMISKLPIIAEMAMSVERACDEFL
ncbi:MAG: hypothetical protein KGJ34_01105 [Patescibacteria group bacterium]|nr:hypothetical protein [Patescibacteria group bacterium]